MSTRIEITIDGDLQQHEAFSVADSFVDYLVCGSAGDLTWNDRSSCWEAEVTTNSDYEEALFEASFASANFISVIDHLVYV